MSLIDFAAAEAQRQISMKLEGAAYEHAECRKSLKWLRPSPCHCHCAGAVRQLSSLMLVAGVAGMAKRCSVEFDPHGDCV